MAVRAKFRLTTYKTHVNHKGEEVRTLELWPVTGTSEENKSFFDSTPSGKIELGVVNQAAWSQFELNKEYYIDFTPAE